MSRMFIFPEDPAPTVIEEPGESGLFLFKQPARPGGGGGGVGAPETWDAGDLDPEVTEPTLLQGWFFSASTGETVPPTQGDALTEIGSPSVDANGNLAFTQDDSYKTVYLPVWATEEEIPSIISVSYNYTLNVTGDPPYSPQDWWFRPGLGAYVRITATEGNLLGVPPGPAYMPMMSGFYEAVSETVPTLAVSAPVPYSSVIDTAIALSKMRETLETYEMYGLIYEEDLFYVLTTTLPNLGTVSEYTTALVSDFTFEEA